MMSVFGIQKEFFRVNMSKTSVSVNTAGPENIC